MHSTRAGLLITVVLLTWPAAGQAIDPLQFFPPGASVETLVSDAAGNLYAGGSMDSQGFVAKLPADGSGVRILYRLSGDGFDSIKALALGPEGTVFATGTTGSSDFPATTPAGFQASKNNPHAFVLKVDAEGRLLFATLIGGTASYGNAIAVNAGGEALVGGQVISQGPPAFATTPGAVASNSDANTGFLVKLDRTGTSFLVAIRGFGMGPVAYDGNNNIYIAGAAYGDSGVSATAGAFQATHEMRVCAGSGMIGIACFYQYVAKISADGTKLLYSTFVTGAFGATPSALAVDPAGNALVAGSTNSGDYPVTPGAYQTTYRVTSVPSITVIGPHFPYVPPPSTGYITKVNADGTGLIWSTFFSGTGADSISGLRLDGQNRIVVTGRSASPDLPGTQSLPAGCRPELLRELPYVAQLSADAAALIGSRYVYGFESASTPMLALRPDGTPVIAAGSGIKPVEMAAATPLACFTDPADNFRIAQAAPGQLITVFGDGFGESATISIDGIPAPRLYASAGQINAQVPPEVAGRDVVTLTVETADGASMSRRLRIVPRAPSAFLALEEFQPVNPVFSCGGVLFQPAYPPLARNEDGSLNSCGNPAAPGSIITFYLNGLGATAPSVSLQYPQSGTILAFEPDPGSPPGVWRMRIQLPPNAFYGAVTPLIDGAFLREAYLGVWVR